jgi:hypothetical protein
MRSASSCCRSAAGRRDVSALRAHENKTVQNILIHSRIRVLRDRTTSVPRIFATGAQMHICYSHFSHLPGDTTCAQGLCAAPTVATCPTKSNIANHAQRPPSARARIQPPRMQTTIAFR